MRSGRNNQRRATNPRPTNARAATTAHTTRGLAARAVVEPVERRVMMAYTPGTLDSTFNAHGILSIASPGTAQTSAIDVQPDGRVIVAGIYRQSATSSVTLISRRNSDGTPDTTFAGGGSVSIPTTATKASVEYDGKILVSGSLLERLNQDGSVDTSFGTNNDGIVQLAVPTAGLVFQSDGKILVGGNTASGPAVTRYNYNGTVDTSYGVSGTRTLAIAGGGAATYTASALTLNSAGDALVSIAVNGNTSLATFAVARLTTGGALDGGFGIGGVAEVKGYGQGSETGGIGVAPDGTIYQLGSYNYGLATGVGYLLAYGATGQTAAISPQAGGVNTFGSDVTIGADNKPVIVGTSVTGTGAATHTVIAVDRFNPVNAAAPVFSPDATFNGTGLATIAYNGPSTLDTTSVGDLGWSVRELGNGNIVVGGTSVNPGGAATSFNVTRLLGDGSLAASVGTITGITFLDTNGDGVQQSTELGATGYGAFIDADHTDSLTPGDTRVFSDATGRYTFNNLAPGTYTIVQLVTTGFRNSQPTSGNSYTITVGAGQTVAAGHDFGVAGTATISGQVFSDLNSNGAKDANEPGLSGFGVFIDENRNGVLDGNDYRVISDANGNYEFTNLFPGTYYVRENVPAGYTLTQPGTFPDVITVAPGQQATLYNIGLHAATV